VIVDLSDVTFLDSAALSVLAGLVRRQHLRHGSVAVLNPSAFALRVMGLSGLSRVVEILFEPRAGGRGKRAQP
jgi:anti-anti-sigma factor